MYCKEDNCSNFSGSTNCSIKNCPNTKTCEKKGCKTKTSNKSTNCSIKACPNTKTCEKKGCKTKTSNKSTNCSIKACPNTKTCEKKGCIKNSNKSTYHPYKRENKNKDNKDQILIRSIKELTSSIRLVSDFLSNFNIKKRKLITNGIKTEKERC